MNGEQIEIMKHTADNRFYCGDSPEMKELVKKGMMESAGRKSFVPDEYFALTKSGKDYLSDLAINQGE